MDDNITHEDLHKQLKEICKSLEIISRAFPKTSDGLLDADGHRRTHEAMIIAAQAQENFWNELKLDLAKKGVWGLFVIVLGFAIAGILAKFSPLVR